MTLSSGLYCRSHDTPSVSTTPTAGALVDIGGPDLDDAPIRIPVERRQDLEGSRPHNAQAREQPEGQERQRTVIEVDASAFPQAVTQLQNLLQAYPRSEGTAPPPYGSE